MEYPPVARRFDEQTFAPLIGQLKVRIFWVNKADRTLALGTIHICRALSNFLYRANELLLRRKWQLHFLGLNFDCQQGDVFTAMSAAAKSKRPRPANNIPHQ